MRTSSMNQPIAEPDALVPMRNRNFTALPASVARSRRLEVYPELTPVNPGRPPRAVIVPL